MPSRYEVSEFLLVSKYEKTREEMLIKVVESDAQARRQRGGIAPQFLFLPSPDLFLAFPLNFFLKVSIALTVKIVVILTVPSPMRTSILFD